MMGRQTLSVKVVFCDTFRGWGSFFKDRDFQSFFLPPFFLAIPIKGFDSRKCSATMHP